MSWDYEYTLKPHLLSPSTTMMKRILAAFDWKERKEKVDGNNVKLDDIPECLIMVISRYLCLEEALFLSTINRQFYSVFKAPYSFHPNQMNANGMKWFFESINRFEIDCRFYRLTHLDLHSLILGDTAENERLYVFDAFQSIETLNIPNTAYTLQSVRDQLYSQNNVPSTLCNICIEPPRFDSQSAENGPAQSWTEMIVGCVVDWHEMEMQSQVISQVLAKFSENIVQLSLKKCYLTVQALKTIAMRMKRLDHLSLEAIRFSNNTENFECFTMHRLAHFHWNCYQMDLPLEWRRILTKMMHNVPSLSLRMPFCERRAFREYLDEPINTFFGLKELTILCDKFNDQLIGFLPILQIQTLRRLKVVFGRNDNVNIHIHFQEFVEGLNEMDNLKSLELDLLNTDSLQIVSGHIHRIRSEHLNAFVLRFRVRLSFGLNLQRILVVIMDSMEKRLRSKWTLCIDCELKWILKECLLWFKWQKKEHHRVQIWHNKRRWSRS